jgi:hypothetical protein
MSDILNEMHLAESKKALDKKADKSGMPKGILSKVYDRGMAAWKGGHRPGTTPQQWALARVNSFITKSSGTWGGADSDLAKQVKGRAESVEEARQLKDKDTEMMVVKHSKVIVIDKSDWNEYKSKGYKIAESYESFIDEALEVKYDKTKQGWFDKQGRRRYLGIAATNAIMKKKIDLAIKTGDWTTFDIKKEEVQFNLEEVQEKYDSDKFFSGKGTPEQRTQLLKLQNKALKAFPSSPKQKEIKKEIDVLRKKMGMEVSEENLKEAKMQVQNLKTLPHRTAFRATIKKVLPNVDAFGSDSNPDFLTFKGSKSDLERLATMAKQYKVGPIRENLEENTSKELPPHLKKLFGKDGKFINPKSQAVFDKMVKDAGGSDAFRKKHKMTNEMDETEVEECWSTHKQVGTKMKGGKQVPNCVPKNEAHNDGHTKSLAKDKETGEPKKYVSGLSDKDKDAHKKHLDKNNDKADDDKSAYKQSPADKKAKTKPSKHTKKFKQMYGEAKDLKNAYNSGKFTPAQIKTLEREYAPLKGRTMSGEQLRKMNGILKKYNKSMLQSLANASIPMLTTGAKSELVINRGMKWTDFKESLKVENVDKEPVMPAKKKKGEDKEAEIDRLEKENQLLKVRNLEKSQKTVEPNRDTGEVPLKVGLAQKILKDIKDGKKVELPKKYKKEIKLDKKPTKVETNPTLDISPSAGGHDTEAPSKEK